MPVGQALAAVEPTPAVKRVIGALTVATLPLNMIYIGVLQVLLPLQVEQLDPLNKVQSLGHITGIAALFATFANPLAGALSDRVHTRWGRRSQWLIGYPLLLLPSLWLLGAANTLLLVAIGLCLVQGLANGYQAVITAVMPERVPVARRGIASSAIGIAWPLALALGTAFAAQFGSHLLTGYMGLGLMLVATASLFVIFNPEPLRAPAGDASRDGQLPGMLQGFFSALRHHDFRWTLLSRFLLVLAYMLVTNYQLYLLQDYVALPVGYKPTEVLVILNIIVTVSMGLATILGGTLSDWLRRRKIFVIGSALCMVVSLMLPLLWPTLYGMWCFAALNGLAFGCYMAVDAALVTQVLPDHSNAARDLGVLNIASAGPQIIAPFIGSLIIVNLGGYATLLVAAACAALLSAAAITPVRGVP